jgi:hypothetical protein
MTFIAKKMLAGVVVAVLSLVLLAPASYAAPSIGALSGGVCPFDCCYPDDPKTSELNDDYYSNWLTYNLMAEYWVDNGLMVGDWDNGWGYYDWDNADKPLSRVMHAFYALDKSAPAGHPSGSILSWAYSFFLGNNGDDVVPSCSTSAYAVQGWNITRGYFIELQYYFFFPVSTGSGLGAVDATVVERAAYLLHESRHVWGCTHTSSSCPAGGSCDYAWDNGCNSLPSTAGTNQYHITWLWEFFKHATNTTVTMKHRALQVANADLARRFQKDPCFRIGPNGNAYQIPTAACNTSVSYSAPAPVYSEEFVDNRCWRAVWTGAQYEVRSLQCSTYPTAYEKWSLEAVPNDGDGRVLIRNQGTGTCLRTESTLTAMLQPTNIYCYRVPWGTKLIVGPCSGRETHFTVAPWAAVNTSPGTLSTNDFWRVHLAGPCNSLYLNMEDFPDRGSCADSDVYGDQTLRVFWCHDGPRQKMRSSGLY